MSEYLEKAIKLLNQALEKDKAEEFEAAIDLYERSFEYLELLRKYGKNPSTIERVNKKFSKYENRVQEIKDYLKNKNKPKKSRKKSKAGNTGSDDYDDDKKKMEEALSSAILQEKPNVHWEDVAGLKAAKEALKEAVILPVKFPHLFKGKRKPWKGILLYGPPGTGKSYLAKAVATEANSTFISVSSSDLVSKYVGESEKLVKQMFEIAREKKPSIVFIDEIDSLASARGDSDSESAKRIKTEFLVQMNGVGYDMTGVLVLAATNIPWGLDSAIRRRFEKRIYIPLPDEEARAQMFKIHLGDTPHRLNKRHFKRLGEMSEGYSGSDISIVVRDALMQPVRRVQSATHFKKIRIPDPENPGKYLKKLTPCSPCDKDAIPKDWTQLEGPELAVPEVTFLDFQKSLLKVKPSVSEKDIKDHIQFTKEFGEDG